MNGMTSIVKIVVRFVSAMIMVFGVYLILHGESYPGGGFGGGVILASSFVLLTLAHGKKFALEKESAATAQLMSSVGALVFLGMIMLSWPIGNLFIKSFMPKTAFSAIRPNLIMISDMAIGVLVGGALFLVFIVFASVRINGKGSN